MATRVRYCLVARSPFHIGERGVGIEEALPVAHSDTLFSALCVMLRELGENLDALLERWPRILMRSSSPQSIPAVGSHPFYLTSAFPCAADVYLFPRPMVPLQGLDEADDPSLGKVIKRIRYVSQPVFEAIIAGRSVADLLLEDDPRKKGRKRVCARALVQDGLVWVTPQEADRLAVCCTDAASGRIRLWDESVTPRVAVDRVTNYSAAYGVGQVTFARGAGLSFLVEYHDIIWRPRLEKALRALGDTGIGGERSSGYGQFSLHLAGPTDIAAPPPSSATGFTTLSLYWPTEAEVQAGVLDEASYSLINRRGWLGSPDAMNLRRRSVRMLAEGSVVRRQPLGALADVKPLDPSPAANAPHDVWRYGIAFPVTCLTPSGRGG